jgi:hypothetical protein
MQKLYELVKSTLQGQSEIQSELRELRQEFKNARSFNSEYNSQFSRGFLYSQNRGSCDNSHNESIVNRMVKEKEDSTIRSL